MKNKSEATEKIAFILETNGTLRDTFIKYLNEKSSHIRSSEFPDVHEIIFNSYNSSLLYGIDRQQYILRMLDCRSDRTVEYFTAWFQYFLCDLNSLRINHSDLLKRWTDSFVRDFDLLSEVIKQVDHLAAYLTESAPEDPERSGSFLQHMVTQCFREGNYEG